MDGPLTDVQITILRRLRDGGVPPTMRELAEVVNMSLSGMRYHYDALLDAGLIANQPTLSRTTIITSEGRVALDRQETGAPNHAASSESES